MQLRGRDPFGQPPRIHKGHLGTKNGEETRPFDQISPRNSWVFVLDKGNALIEDAVSFILTIVSRLLIGFAQQTVLKYRLTGSR